MKYTDWNKKRNYVYILLGDILRIIFMEFVIYSIFGYLLECIYSGVIEKRINFNRGFFMGPYCPIYGFSLLCISLITSNVEKYILQVMLSSILIAFIEYVTSFVLEKIFCRTWWDYRRKKCNLKGRVCLENLIVFGLGAVFITRKITPLIENVIGGETGFIIVLSFFLFIVFAIDLFISCKRHYLNVNNDILENNTNKKVDDIL